MFSEFRKFILRGNVVDLAVGVVIGAAFNSVVQPINKLTEISIRKKDTEDPETKKCPYCLSVVPVKATRCKFCTSRFEDKKA
jgi:large conductance mechanosensitive channel